MRTRNDSVSRVIVRDPPDAVTYDLSVRDRVTVTLPRGSKWSSGLHWHESHVEYLQVLQGSIRVTLDGSTSVVSASSSSSTSRGSSPPPEIKIEKFAWHSWERANPDCGEAVIVVERTDPADGDKALFFWNLNGVILDAPRMLRESAISRMPASLRPTILDLWVSLNLFVIFHHLDNIPVFVNFASKVQSNNAAVHRLLALGDWIVSHIVLYIAAWIGWVLNARPLRLKYTPAREYAEWMERKRRGRTSGKQ